MRQKADTELMYEPKDKRKWRKVGGVQIGRKVKQGCILPLLFNRLIEN